jgi:hypothetical protein
MRALSYAASAISSENDLRASAARWALDAAVKMARLMTRARFEHNTDGACRHKRRHKRDNRKAKLIDT